MKQNHGAQYELSIDSVPHSYRDRHDIALHRQGNHNRKSPLGRRRVSPSASVKEK